MQLENYDDGDGRRVRLTADERDALLAEYDDDPDRQIALELMARCGCRSQEAVDARRRDVVRGDSGRWFLRIPEGKGEKERMTPMPTDLAGMIRGRGLDEEEAIVVVSTRTLRRWVRAAADRCAEAEDDGRWQYVTPHDLRRTWGHLALEAEVMPSVVMQWGGWEDYETFQEHYLGKHSETVMDREAGKIGWL